MHIEVTRFDFSKWGFTQNINTQNINPFPGEQNIALHLGKRSIYLVWAEL